MCRSPRHRPSTSSSTGSSATCGRGLSSSSSRTTLGVSALASMPSVAGRTPANFWPGRATDDEVRGVVSEHLDKLGRHVAAALEAQTDSGSRAVLAEIEDGLRAHQPGPRPTLMPPGPDARAPGRGARVPIARSDCSQEASCRRTASTSMLSVTLSLSTMALSAPGMGPL